jgi:hypothetical protein
MDLRQAFQFMLGCVSAADVSPRQVTAILTWEDAALQVAAHADFWEWPAEIPAIEPGVHRRWLAASRAMIADLAAQGGRADQEHAQMVTAEADALELAAELDRAAAAAVAAGDPAAGSSAAAAAERAREAADIAGDLADLAMQWAVAARDAATLGERVVRDEDAVTRPVAEAQARAGGPGEVAGDRSYNTREPVAA